MFLTEAYERGYSQAYSFGELTEAIAISIRLIKMGEIDMLLKLGNFSEEYISEIKQTIEKYPGYSEDHLVEKAIFRSTHLPWVIKEKKE